ncbi:MAG: hypothetical protein M1150_02950, partial [Patescibacteria group bacterium]|nr:hypothetical protein [Patescibacteria group bacterium]
MNKRLLIIIGIILIAVSIPFTVWLVKQQQQYKSQAAIPGGKIKVTLTPEKGTFLVGQETPVKIDLDTQGEEIQGAELSLFYRYGNADPELIVVDKDDSKAGTQLKRERTDVNYIDYDVSNNLVSKVMNIKLSVWSQMPNYIRTDPGKSMTLATIYFKALSVPANPTVALEFDNTNRYENNVATTKNGVLDELDIPVNGSYTISNAEIQNPIISGINPSSGKVGDAVAISGSNFGTSKGTVKFGDKTASDNDTTWGDKSITTKVPSGLSAGAFQITVTTTDSKTSGGVSFTITDNPPNKTLNPTISSINPSSGKVGDAVAISGSNFGTSKGTVKFGDKSVGDLEVTWGDSSISVKVPSLSAGTIKVKIITSDSKTSGEISFEVKASTSDSKENKISDNGGNSGNNNNSNNGNTSSNSSTNNPTGSTSSTTKT